MQRADDVMMKWTGSQNEDWVRKQGDRAFVGNSRKELMFQEWTRGRGSRELERTGEQSRSGDKGLQLRQVVVPGRSKVLSSTQ